MHPVKYGTHHRLQQQQQQQQQFMVDDNDSSSASVFFISDPQQQQQQQQQAVFPYPLHSQLRQHSGPVTHHLFQAQFQPFQQQQPFSDVNFKLGLNENSGGKDVDLPLNHRQNEATFWKPLNKVSQSTSERSKTLDGKYRLFGELEEIYGENLPANVGISIPLTEFQGHNNGGVAHGSETTSIEKEASSRKKIHKKRRMNSNDESSSSSIAVFLERLVKQVSDHQECLHKSFMEIIERMDEERSVKEESWRLQEAERRNREAVARAQEQALASSREALIVSYLEKITGETINLPQRTPLMPVQPENAIAKADNNNSRWPIAEVEALIQVRCNLESKFQEPGLKGPLWEEVSSFMSSSGYHRSAKKCKEKWDNINKYFRKSKENGKKRSQQSKTCSYFDQLDQLYSRIPINSDLDMQMQGDSDLVAQGSHGNSLENDGGEREDDDNDSDEEAE